MDHSMADAVIVAALAALCFGWLYLRHRRMEMLHRERLVAMEKGLPLPEVFYESPRVSSPPHPHLFLHIGIPMLTVGVGTMVALRMVGFPGWPLPLPVALSGVGLMLYHVLAGRKGQPGSRGK